jgi:uncharacterized protein YlbG (UPF0298 family)
MNKIIVAVLTILLISKGVFAQQKSSTNADNVLNELAKELQQDPNNPLKIDQNFLNNLSQLVGDQRLKNTLLSYSNTLGTDKDLSYRQVYFDLSKILGINPDIAKANEFFNAANKLDLIFDNYSLLNAKLKSLKSGSPSNVEFGSFINDPATLSSLTNITGSYEGAMAIGLGVELVTSIVEANAESHKIKEDYKKLAKVSNDVLYAEGDPSMNSALIDAYLGVEAYQMITPMFRYDFDNGASLRVENGILKYINNKSGVTKNLLVVDKRHDGNYHKYKEIRGGFFSSLAVSPDEKYFYLYVNTNPISDVQCKDCLDKSGYMISIENGEVKYADKGGFTPSAGGYVFNLYNARFDNESLIYPGLFANGIGGYGFYSYSFNTPKGQKKILHISGLDKNKNFLLNNTEKRFKDDNAWEESLFDHKVQFYYFYPKDEGMVSLLWASKKNFEGDSKVYTSSMLQVAKGKDYLNPDGMVNELTGLAMKRNGDVVFVSKEGRIGKLSTADFKLEDVTTKMRSAFGKRILGSYDFVQDKQFVSEHGQIVTSPFPNALLPTLKFTPDEKHLIYIQKDSLYVISPENLSAVKRFGLTVQPYGSFFTKEGGDWILNIQAWNDFRFPVVKKYSLAKLSQMNTRQKPKPSTAVQPVKTGNPSSVADELKKLKELLDQGVLTQKEFDVEKKKLLSKNGN